jgi:hypothetical protein
VSRGEGECEGGASASGGVQGGGGASVRQVQGGGASLKVYYFTSFHYCSPIVFLLFDVNTHNHSL